ncbi:PucR family transcriptional regulator [Desulfosporosinus fructosivorans]
MNIEEAQSVQTDLLRIIAEGAGVAGIVNILAKATELPVVVTNEFYKVLGSSHQDYPRNSFVRSCINGTEKNPGLCQIKLEQSIKLAYVFPSYIKNETLGFLYIFSDASDRMDIKDFGKIASLVLTIQLTKDKELLLAEKRYVDAFLFDLLYGNIESGEDILARGELWGWDLSRPQCVLVFELDDYDYFTEDKNLLEILIESVRFVMKEMGENPILTKKKGEVIAILFKTKGSKHEQREYMKLVVDKIQSLAQQRIHARVLRLGIGRIYENPKEIFRSYQEAKVALELGKYSRLRTPFFEYLGLARILYNHDRQELAELYQETLGELERYDSAHNTELMKTLETFLSHRCDLKETAKTSYIHPNTLRYRLKKIQEILDLDFDDFDTKLNLMVAFKIKHLKVSDIDE